MKMLMLQEMTDAQRVRVNTRLGQERKKLGRELTNAEHSRVKNEIVAEISREVELAAKKARAQKRKDKLAASDETYSWSTHNHRRGFR
ncbi:DUF3811 domain-containing protein [Providencia stuartii]|uniref:YjbD family (DUF3811) n=1 Tax=Providencia stuartii ATCC 25827 TaxID=471874 RepID=A0AA86YJK3_PROST|nr:MULTISPECIES: DUF3811 domain-containing protein [Providencia]EDU59452.1 hypothetical protein PROSTU_02641 [Providencia stuartii ATCC 25827]MBS7783895.1 DUF3811 domain-containing protein [Providencia thailandensis]MTC82126.1 DUF3811 domain-containing protein [Providencia stuartii]MTC93173.1 DUF3811 domain-containing protein [Providencia stuartii]